VIFSSAEKACEAFASAEHLNTGRSHPKAESYQNFPPFPAALLVQLFFRKGA